jgi:hypothetical protein
MRTTLSIDPEVLSAARKLAASRSTSLGEVISELARRGLEARAKVGSRHGFPVFEVPANSPPLTPEQVREDEDEA